MQEKEYDLLEDITEKYAPSQTCFSLGPNYQLNFNDQQFTIELAQFILQKMASSQDGQFSFIDFQQETQLEGSLDQISQYIQEKTLEIDHQGEIKIDFSSIQNEKNQEVLNNFLADPNCSLFLQDFALQTIDYLTKMTNRFDQSEDADELLIKILAEIRGKYQDFFNENISQENQNEDCKILNWQKQNLDSMLKDLSLEIKKLGENQIDFEKENLQKMITCFKRIGLEETKRDWPSAKAKMFLPYQRVSQDKGGITERDDLSYASDKEQRETQKWQRNDGILNQEIENLLELICGKEQKELSLETIIRAQNKFQRLFQQGQDLQDDMQFLSKENHAIQEKLVNTQSDLEKFKAIESLSSKNELNTESLKELLGMNQKQYELFKNLLRQNKIKNGDYKTAENLNQELSQNLIGKNSLKNKIKEFSRIIEDMRLNTTPLRTIQHRLDNFQMILKTLLTTPQQCKFCNNGQLQENQFGNDFELMQLKNQNLLEQNEILKENLNKMQEELNIIGFQKQALEKRITLIEEDEEDLLDSKNSDPRRISEEQIQNDYKGYQNHLENKLEPVDEEINSQVQSQSNSSQSQQLIKSLRKKIFKISENYKYSNFGNFNLFNDSAFDMRRKSKNNIFSQANIFKEIQKSNNKQRSVSLPRLPLREKQEIRREKKSHLKLQLLTKNIQKLNLTLENFNDQELKIKKIKDHLFVFQKNLQELKNCLKDNNFDIAKEKMSLLRGNIERPGVELEFQYSEDEKENSFNMQQESQKQDENKNLKELIEKVLQMSFNMIKNDIQQVDENQLTVFQIPEILDIIQQKIQQKEDQIISLKDKQKPIEKEEEQQNNQYAEEVFKDLLVSLQEQTNKSQFNVERIYQLIIKMVDEEQEFTEQDENTLSSSLDIAKESNQQLKELIDFLNKQFKNFLKQTILVTQNTKQEIKKMTNENEELRNTLEEFKSKNQIMEEFIKNNKNTNQKEQSDDEFEIEEMRLSSNAFQISNEVKKNLSKMINLLQKNSNFEKVLQNLENAKKCLEGNDSDQSIDSVDMKLEQNKIELNQSKNQLSEKWVKLENENYILNDRVQALEQLLKLKEDQINNKDQGMIGGGDDSERKLKKLNQKITSLKNEKQKLQEINQSLKEKYKKKDEENQDLKEMMQDQEKQYQQALKQVKKTKPKQNKETNEIIQQLSSQVQNYQQQAYDYKQKMLSYKQKWKREKEKSIGENPFADNEQTKGISIRKKAEMILIANDLRQKEQQIKRLQEQLRHYKNMYKDDNEKSGNFSNLNSTKHKKSQNISNISHK